MATRLEKIKTDNEIIVIQEKKILHEKITMADFEKAKYDKNVGVEIHQEIEDRQSKYDHIKEALLVQQQDEKRKDKKITIELPSIEEEMLEPEVILAQIFGKIIDELNENTEEDDEKITDDIKQAMIDEASNQYKTASQQYKKVSNPPRPIIKQVLETHVPKTVNYDLTWSAKLDTLLWKLFTGQNANITHRDVSNLLRFSIFNQHYNQPFNTVFTPSPYQSCKRREGEEEQENPLLEGMQQPNL